MTFCKTRFLFDKFHDMNVAEDGAADGGAELYLQVEQKCYQSWVSWCWYRHHHNILIITSMLMTFLSWSAERVECGGGVVQADVETGRATQNRF